MRFIYALIVRGKVNLKSSISKSWKLKIMTLEDHWIFSSDPFVEKIQQIEKLENREMILKTFLLFISTSRIQAQSQTDDRPNIIFVITDDLGWSDVSWNNIKTNSTPFMADLIHSGQASSLRNSYATHRIGFCIFWNQFGW